MLRLKLLIVVIVGAFARLAVAQTPGLIFDSSTPPYPSGGFSSPDFGDATDISVSNSVDVTAIGILDNTPSANEFRFAILSQPSDQFLYISAPQSFPADPTDELTWKVSAPMNLELIGGNDYLVGYVRGGSTNDYFDSQAVTMNGISSGLNSYVLNGFAAPTYGFLFDMGFGESVRLYGNIPEPASFAGIAIAGVLALRRTKRRRS